jgi:hypothetical protein
MMRFARRSLLGAGKTPGWAGATPLFGLPAAQKVFGVAPAQCFFGSSSRAAFARVWSIRKLKEDTCQSLTSHRKS